MLHFHRITHIFLDLCSMYVVLFYFCNLYVLFTFKVKINNTEKLCFSKPCALTSVPVVNVLLQQFIFLNVPSNSVRHLASAMAILCDIPFGDVSMTGKRLCHTDIFCGIFWCIHAIRCQHWHLL